MTEPPIVQRSEPPVVNPVSSGLMAGNQPAAVARDDCQAAHPTSIKALLTTYMHKRWAVLLLLFGATAALGLPILWKSRGFSRVEKIVWTVFVSLYTVLVFWIFFKVMWWSYTNIRESLS